MTNDLNAKIIGMPQEPRLGSSFDIIHRNSRYSVCVCRIQSTTPAEVLEAENAELLEALKTSNAAMQNMIDRGHFAPMDSDAYHEVVDAIETNDAAIAKATS